MNNLKKGQPVVCIDDCDSELEKGKTYIISKVDGDFVECKGLKKRSFLLLF